MNTVQTLAQIIFVAFVVVGVASLYSALRAVKRATRRTLDQA